MIGLLWKAGAFKQQEQAAIPACLAALVDGRKTVFDVVPDFRPQRLCRGAERLRMLVGQGGPIGVVVEGIDVRPPPEPHLETGREEKAHSDLERLRPRRRATEACRGPIMGAHHVRHVAVAHEDVGVRRSQSHSHRPQVRVGTLKPASDGTRMNAADGVPIPTARPPNRRL